MQAIQDDLEVSQMGFPSVGFLFGGQVALAALIAVTETYADAHRDSEPDPDDPDMAEIVALARKVDELMVQDGSVEGWGEAECGSRDYGTLPSSVAQRSLGLIPHFADEPELVLSMVHLARDAMDIGWFADQVTEVARKKAEVQDIIVQGNRTLRAMDYSLGRIEAACAEVEGAEADR